MGSPRLLLCDEPTGNLDSVSTSTVLDMFAALNQHGMTIVMITHDHDVARRCQPPDQHHRRRAHGGVLMRLPRRRRPGPHRPTIESEIVRPSGMSIKDLTNESIAGLFARPGRMVLTVFGTVIGLAALVATLGLSRTAGNRIVGRFDELAATEIVVTPRPSASGPIIAALPWDAPERLEPPQRRRSRWQLEHPRRRISTRRRIAGQRPPEPDAVQVDGQRRIAGPVPRRPSPVTYRGDDRRGPLGACRSRRRARPERCRSSRPHTRRPAAGDHNRRRHLSRHRHPRRCRATTRPPRRSHHP